MNTETAIETAEALLATSRHRLTGKEIEACEWAISESFADDVEVMESPDPDEPDRDDFNNEFDYEDAVDERAEECREMDEIIDAFGDLFVTLKRLHVEFYATICNWIDSNNRATSARAIETHNRLHQQAA